MDGPLYCTNDKYIYPISGLSVASIPPTQQIHIANKNKPKDHLM